MNAPLHQYIRMHRIGLLVMAVALLPRLNSAQASSKNCHHYLGGLRAFVIDRKNVARHRPNRFYESWPIDGDNSLFSTYYELFAPVLNGLNFESLLENRKENGLSTHVADFFGSSVFLTSTSYLPEIPKKFNQATETNPNNGSGILFIKKTTSSPAVLP
jgi:hypothetical protein